MNENDVAKTLQIIGILEVICGIILGIALMVTIEDFGWIGIAVMISSFITCMLFVGFAEIIKLLQKSVNAQEEILAYTKSKAIKDDNAPQTMLQDIELNLPEM